MSCFSVLRRSLGVGFLILGFSAGASAEEKSAPVAPETVKTQPPAPKVETSQAAPESPEVEVAEGRSEKYGKPHGLMGPVTLGPAVTLVGVPTLFRGGLEGKFKNHFGFGVHYGFIPSSLFSKFVKDVTIKAKTWEARVRWFPFQRALFLGLGAGKQTLEGSKSETILTYSTSVNVKIATTYLTPHFGWRWQWASGFFFGLDLGYQIALKAKTSLGTNIDLAIVKETQQYKDLVKKVEDEGNKVGKIGLPSLTLLQVGYLF